MHTPERAPDAGEGVCKASEAGVMKKRWSSREPGGLWGQGRVVEPGAQLAPSHRGPGRAPGLRRDEQASCEDCPEESVCVYLCVYMHTCVNVYAHVHMPVYMHMYVFVCACVYVHKDVCICAYVQAYRCTCAS